MSKIYIPTAVQFEITYKCNNACVFCYNHFGGVGKKSQEIPIEKAFKVLKNLAEAKVFSVNLNGGEPLMHSKFFHLCEYGKNLGLDLHLNTNATLIDNKHAAKQIATYFDAVATTVLSAPNGPHDKLAGRSGAFTQVERGIKLLLDEGVYVAVNITLSKLNISTLRNTLNYLHSLGIQTLLITSVVTAPGIPLDKYSITKDELFSALREIKIFQEKYKAFSRIGFPQPYPLCLVPADLHEFIAKNNIVCTIARNTARITPDAKVTPCTLVSEPIIGDLSENTFLEIWEAFEREKFFSSYLPFKKCFSCLEISRCGGGCYGVRGLFSNNTKMGVVNDEGKT